MSCPQTYEASVGSGEWGVHGPQEKFEPRLGATCVLPIGSRPVIYASSLLSSAPALSLFLARFVKFLF